MDQIGVKSLYKLNGDTLLKYFKYLKERNFAGSVQQRSIKNLKTYYNWLEQENIIEDKNQIFKNQNFSTYEYQQKIAKEFIQAKTINQITKNMLAEYQIYIPTIRLFIKQFPETTFLI